MERVSFGMLRRRYVAAFLVLSFVNGLGCSIKFQHGNLDPPAIQEQRGLLHHSNDAEGLDRRVGWGRFTVFAIPLVPIYVVGDDGQEFMLQVRDALELAGYEPIAVEPDEPVDGPVFRCHFGETSFSNYTWIFPFVPTWGSITVTAELIDADGTILWSQNFTGDGSTLNFFNGYNSSAKQSVTELLNAMIQSLAAEDFQLALSRGRSHSSPRQTAADPPAPLESSRGSGAEGLPEGGSPEASSRAKDFPRREGDAR